MTSTVSPGDYQLKKRNRTTLVCTNCKRRKIKCDRGYPCSACLKSKRLKGSCKYDSPESVDFSITPPKKVKNISQDSNTNISKSIETKLTNNNYNTQIFDLKLNCLKYFLIMRKQSKTEIIGSVSGFPSAKERVSFSSIKKCLGAERRAWKTIHGRNECLHKLINTICNVEEIIVSIQNILVPNGHAIYERIVYFKDHLNDFLYNGFVDMSHILSSFSKFFSCSEGCFHFHQPIKNYTYSELSLILAVVESTILFSKHEINRSFKFSLDSSLFKFISRLATDCLAVSNFQRKKNFSSLIALIILKDNHYNYSSRGTDSMDNANSQIIIEICIGLSFHLGLHRDPASVHEVHVCRDSLDYSVYRLPPANSRTIWNYIKMVEACNVIHSGTPLMIHDQFSEYTTSLSYSDDWMINFINLEREACILFNSINAISISDVDKLLGKFLKLNSSLGTFKELLYSSHSDIPPSLIIVSAQKLSIKFKLMRSIGVFYHFLQNRVGDLNMYPKEELTSRNLDLIKEKAKFYKIQFMKFCFSSWGALKELFNPSNIFGDNINKYLLYLKLDLLRVLYPTLIGVAFCLFSNPLFFKSRWETKRSENFDIIKLNSIDSQDIETSMNLQTEGKSITDERLVQSFEFPLQAIEISTDIHSSISKFPLLTENYGYFCLMKAISIFACFSDSLHKLNSSCKSTDSEHLKEVVELTRAKMESTMRLGYIDLGFSLENNEDTIQNWLDSIFDENGLFTFLTSDTIPSPTKFDLGPSNL